MAINIRNNRSQRLRSVTKKQVSKQSVKDILLARQEICQFTPAQVTGTAFSSAGAIIRLTDFAQGDDINNRRGDQIFMKDLRFQLTAFMAAAATSCTYRLIIFTDSMGSGTTVGVTDVLQTATFSSPWNTINMQRKRFKIYYDKSHALVGATNAQEVTDIVQVRLNKTRWFNDATASATNVGKNAPYALVIASAANGVYTHQWGISYTDS